ncbi:MAG: dephospho-CoA kinase [Flavobacteriales bacterium]|nr:dephospho-CoA kinase [Flavobacteriales bacterium]MCB9168181.1 dephospho-CoA kinase [Flavobacteriales bacterium]MCB9194254.1 dephospho-CoA kinase [Flavobacteriales bacterium]
MYSVGVTGGIGSGKSLVCRMLSVLGVPVFEADEEGRNVLAFDPTVRAGVVREFGEKVLGPDGRPDRSQLAERVFRDKEALLRLNALVHPAVRMRFTAWCKKQEAPYVAMGSALLIGPDGAPRFDRLVVVSAPRQLRLRRVMERDGASAEEVQRRMDAQASDEELTQGADAILINDGRRMLLPQVLDLHEDLLRRARNHG